MFYIVLLFGYHLFDRVLSLFIVERVKTAGLVAVAKLLRGGARAGSAGVGFTVGGGAGSTAGGGAGFTTTVGGGEQWGYEGKNKNRAVIVVVFNNNGGINY